MIRRSYVAAAAQMLLSCDEAPRLGRSSSSTSCGSSATACAARRAPTRSKATSSRNRSLPWWAVGLSVMATQMSAVTLVGTTGQAYATGLRFVQLYFGLPLAMIILSLTVVPFFTARGSTRRTNISSGGSTCARGRSRSFLFLMGRALSLGVTLAAPAVVMSAILGWTLPVTVLVICVPMIVYTTHRRRAGGRLDRRQADVRRRRRACWRRSAFCSYGILQRRRLRPRAAPGRRDRPAEGDRLHVRSARDLHVLVGHDRRPVPDAVVFRLRSEPGAALPDGEVGRRGAAFAADERLRQDSAAAADSGDRRAGVRVLPVSDAADAVQPRLRRAGRGEPARGASTPRSSSEFDAAIDARRAAADARRPRGVSRQRRARARHPRASASAIVKRGDRRRSATPTSTTCFRPSSRRACRSAWSG